MLRHIISTISPKMIPSYNVFIEVQRQQVLQSMLGFLHRAHLSTEKQEKLKKEFKDDNVEIAVNQRRNPFDSDDYITPYRFDHETNRSNNQMILQHLRTKLELNEKQLQKVLTDDLMSRSSRDLLKTLAILEKVGIAKTTILEHPWLIAMQPKQLLDKINEIKTLEFRDISDFVPFLRLSYSRLQKIVTFLRREAKTLPCENRVYFISDKLKIEPKLVSKYLSKRLFMLEMPYEILLENLNNMIGYGVAPVNILRDLWAFRYKPKSVQTRLERAKTAKKDKIMPWMVRCPEGILQRSLKRSLEEKELLGDNNSVVEYVATRLGFEPETTKAIMLKHPAVFRVRVTKIKEILDFLLDEAGFTPHDVANVPRILCHGLETTKARLAELKSVDCIPSSLIIVCRSKREYEKFLRSWIQMSNKSKQS